MYIECGDCLTLLNKVENESVDLVLTDPPYNISFKNASIDRSKCKLKAMRRDSPIALDFGEWDRKDRDEFLSFTRDWYKLVIDKLKDGGTFISFFNKEDISYFSWVGKELGINFQDILVWHKTNPVPSISKSNYLSACEFIYFGSKNGSPKAFNYKSDNQMHGVFETTNASIYGVTPHPTEKPIGLMEQLLLIHSNKGDTVLDPFMGSGTTGIACKNLDRNFIGFEKDEKYFDIAKQRINGTYIKIDNTQKDDYEEDLFS